MLNANNKVNYEPSIKRKEKKYSLSTVLAWLYLKTIGRILPGRWNQWAENILYYNKIIADNGVQIDDLLNSNREKELTEQVKSLEEEKINETVKKENKSLRAQNTELESEVSKLKKESDTQIKQLESQLEEKQAELEQAKKKNTEVEHLTRELESTQQQLEQEKTNLNTIEKKKQDLESEINELKEQAKGKDAEVENLKQQLEKEKTNLNTIEKEKKELEGEVKELKEKLQILEKNSTEIEKQKADLEKKLEFSQGENKKLQEQVEHLSAKKTENITTFSTRNNKEIPNQSLTSKDKQTEVSRPESGQQKLKNELKDANKKPEDINKETKALDAKSMLSTTKSITKSIFSTVNNKLLGNEDLNNFLSKENKELKRSFPEFKGEHFCHNVLKKTIQSLSNQSDGKFESNKLLALLESNFEESARTIIKTKVDKVVEEVVEEVAKTFVTKYDLTQVKFVQKCAKKLKTTQAELTSIVNSWSEMNCRDNDSAKKFVVQKLTEAEMKCFSDKIQQLASSIRDKFLSPDQRMCNQTQGRVNEYQLTEKAKKEYTPNSSMSHTTISNMKRLAR
ncbi:MULTISPECIES: coiled-coil domain-containing protein [unclassified Wolbachia]|uniref:hypothetical protein n=1 Tax=unclassified Wolbachia TaxID=2640676 RepID=UPI0022265DF4|nr:hypothetical protein [Wolbachia endosymbiont (group B) of Euphydryas aurinia]